MSSDGMSNCIWCQTKEDGGICLSDGDAKSAVEIMGVTCPNYTNSLALEATRTPPDFNCFHSAWDGDNAQVTCNESNAKDDSPCVWCSMADGGVAGACLSNDEAIMANGQFGLACPLDVYLEPAEETVKSGIPDVNCFKAAWVADNAELACGESKDKVGNPCVWCQTDGDKAGACLSRPEAGTGDGLFGLKCPSSDEAVLDEPLESF
mmetsp:Transcript_10782/g.23887  ORF Transcript_10782/g.23887 Transcript_10782/m.23887 type:complete len:207 (-) Transcript_10782:200-820(-)|eukprot:CAMPEP_0172317178 /NCGR_PEP_ID=MMETSP1058-20130122/30798_1 /TAXON_ID=83371 /ORGANISM="Detonula confervacea, Strain CCMP 353" /LENGTH=206 /DNA_ID=CAMNT_0013031677 /DNA_START=183 /DNA_END=803 /DNA_ORIENTATION=+